MVKSGLHVFVPGRDGGHCKALETTPPAEANMYVKFILMVIKNMLFTSFTIAASPTNGRRLHLFYALRGKVSKPRLEKVKDWLNRLIETIR